MTATTCAIRARYAEAKLDHHYWLALARRRAHVSRWPRAEPSKRLGKQAEWIMSLGKLIYIAQLGVGRALAHDFRRACLSGAHLEHLLMWAPFMLFYFYLFIYLFLLLFATCALTFARPPWGSSGALSVGRARPEVAANCHSCRSAAPR